MTSYKGNLEDYSFEDIEKLVEKIYKHFTFREINMKNFREDMVLYTRLANQAFA